MWAVSASSPSPVNRVGERTPRHCRAVLVFLYHSSLSFPGLLECSCASTWRRQSSPRGPGLCWVSHQRCSLLSPGGPCLPLLPQCRAPSPRGQNRSASLARSPRFLAVGDELILVPTDPWLRQLPAEVTVRWLSCCLCLPVSSLNRCRWGESLWCANTAPQRVPASRAPQGQHCPSASSGASWKFPWPSSVL